MGAGAPVVASGAVVVEVPAGAVPVALAGDGAGLPLGDGVPVGLAPGDGEPLVDDVPGVAPGDGLDGPVEPDDRPMLLMVVPDLELFEIG